MKPTKIAPTPEQLQHFYSFIVKTESCWLWRSCRPVEYGQHSINGYQYMAHRLSYVIHKGEIPKGMVVCHKCDIPSCVNPDHLFAGTHADNAQDMYAKGRNNSNPKRGKDRRSYGSYLEYIDGKPYASLNVKKPDGRYKRIRRRVNDIAEIPAVIDALKAEYQPGR